MGKSRVLALLAAASIVASACGSSTASPTTAPAPTQGGVQPTAVAPTAAPSATGLPATDATVYPRAQTLYTSGKQWGAPSTWNPLDPNAAMGVVGLQYETLFLYDPIKDVYTPWLASGGSWDSTNTTYTINVRQGVTWSDGSAFTAADVAFSINLYQNTTLGSDLFTFVKAVTASGNNVVVTFQGTPAYQEWMQDLYQMPMVPAAIWTQYNNENIFKFLNQNGVGTGPYMYKTAAQDRMVWVKNPNWWATKALGLSVQPTYIVDIVNSSNNVALGQLLSGGLDLDNNYLPGIAQIVNGGYGITTYFAGPPYMLAGNTAWLVPNTKKKPLDDPAFRKALAEAINPQNVVVKDYGNIVAAASPTGLLPVWDKYVDQNVVKTLGVSFNTAKAKADLAAAGYKVGSDGFVTNKDGSAIKLNLEVPDGWSDWMEAENLIAADAALAGININPTHPAYATVVNDRNGTSSAAPTFDLVINNDVQIGSTPWTYYDYIFRQPEIAAGPARNRNFEQYDNATAWALVQKLDQTLDVTAMQAITSQLQTIQLTDEPIIPLWYNGEWSQVNNSVWTNWPSDTTYHVQPATWNGYWQMGAIYMLTEIKPAG
ncbi:MAG: ABC transporter substrate-binding protein [Candidatus Limnocylindrales bacterium]|jgi:peptide/nickel transport system substrate-binding protein